MDTKVHAPGNQTNTTTSAPDEGGVIQDDATQTTGILETIGDNQDAARARIIELIGKAQKKAAQGDMNTAFDILATADMIADFIGDTHAKETIAMGTELLYGVVLRTKK